MKTAWGFWAASWGATRKPSTCKLLGRKTINLSCLLHGREARIHNLSDARLSIHLFLFSRRLLLILVLNAVVGIYEICHF